MNYDCSLKPMFASKVVFLIMIANLKVIQLRQSTQDLLFICRPIHIQYRFCSSNCCFHLGKFGVRHKTMSHGRAVIHPLILRDSAANRIASYHERRHGSPKKQQSRRNTISQSFVANQIGFSEKNLVL